MMFVELLREYSHLTESQKSKVVPAMLGRLQKMEQLNQECSLEAVGNTLHGVMKRVKYY